MTKAIVRVKITSDDETGVKASKPYKIHHYFSLGFVVILMQRHRWAEREAHDTHNSRGQMGNGGGDETVRKLCDDTVPREQNKYLRSHGHAER